MNTLFNRFSQLGIALSITLVILVSGVSFSLLQALHQIA